MHITYHPHTLLFKQPAGTSRGVYRTRKVWYVTVNGQANTDSRQVMGGRFGIGECAPLPDLSCDAMPDEAYEKVLAEACRMTEECEGKIPYEFLRPYPSILFGIETAMRSFQASLHDSYSLCPTSEDAIATEFLAGNESITINGLVWMGTFEEMMARMEEKLALGFRCIKIKIGAIDWEREISLIRALRDRFPKEVVEIRVDANGGFSQEVAMSRLQELARYDIHSIEQPIRQGNWEAMGRLCCATPIPIALDEELIGINELAEKERMLKTVRPQYIILKPSLHGGLKGCREWMQIARTMGIGYWITSALESNVGLNSIAHFVAQESVCEQRYRRAKASLTSSLEERFVIERWPMPQGLGTGQLYVENYDAVRLDLVGDQLWYGSQADRQFRKDYCDFLAEWNNPAPTVEVNTSGSTGTPKKMYVEKSRMMASARMTLDFLGLAQNPDIAETAVICMPLRYIAGKMMVVRALVGHLNVRLITPSSHPLRDLAIEAEHGSLAVPTFIAVTPMQALYTLETEGERQLFCRIPVIIVGGGAISPELLAALQQCQGKVYSTYGMTETLSHIAMRRLNGPDQSEWYTLMAGVKVEKNEEGCLVIDAPAICPEPLITNDLCEFEEGVSTEGAVPRFRILGRRDNIVCSGGIKLSLEALEAKLGDVGCPYLLTAVPDAHLGEALTLIYIYTRAQSEGFSSNESLEESVDAQQQHIQRRIDARLDRYERPRHIFCVKELPLTETGKPARAKARELACSQLTK